MSHKSYCPTLWVLVRSPHNVAIFLERFLEIPNAKIGKRHGREMVYGDMSHKNI